MKAGKLTRDDSQQVVPAAAHAAAVLVDELPEGDAHLLLHRAGPVHVAADAEQLGACAPAESRLGSGLGAHLLCGRQL